ncbi:MAG: 30S ribosomal protein S4 [Ruminococcaceae bacterium]|nr:30S ribosomal protein S4 [Oscillospiraceae bacterium]
MAKYTGPACRQCRREGVKMFLKGERCFSDKCPITRRGTVPGQHGAARARMMKNYGLQLREKQKTRRYYGILETQFRNYYEKADAQEGMSGVNLLIMIERRFDNVVYRMGLAESRRDARQLVRHGHFTVNGKNANIPSMLLKVGDEIAIKDSKKDRPKIKTVIEKCEGKIIPKWLEVDKENGKGKIIAMPQREDIDFEIDEQLIVELYSK